MAESAPPVVLATRRGDALMVRCPYCGHWHLHGGQPGHRAAHCVKPTADTARGYVVITREAESELTMVHLAI